MRNFLVLFIILMTLIFILVWPFMGNKESNKTDAHFNVVVSNFAIFDIVEHLSSDVKVKNILPFGSDIHTYEPTPKDIVEIKKSDLFVFSGEDLEPWMRKFHFEKNSLKLEPFVTLKTAHHHHEAKANDVLHHKHQAGFDPHYWLDIQNMIKMTEAISSKLEEKLPLQKEQIEKNKKEYIKQLKHLDAFFKLELQNCKQDTIVTNHNAFEYLADRYGFKVKAISGLSPEAQSSARVMKELITFVKEKNVKVLFFESFVSDKLMQTIAKESGVQRVEVLLPLANVNQKESKEGFISLMQHNAEEISYALECHNSMVK